MQMVAQYIKLKNLININTQLEVCSQYNNRKVDYSKSVIKVGEPLRICDLETCYFQHEEVIGIKEYYDGFEVTTSRKTWFFEYCDEEWNSIGGE